MIGISDRFTTSYSTFNILEKLLEAIYILYTIQIISVYVKFGVY